MAYSKSNPPVQLTQDIGNRGPANFHMNGTDAPATVRVNGYITNAKDLGLKVGDTISYLQTGVTPVVRQTFLVLAINANGSADLSDGTAVSNTNTD